MELMRPSGYGGDPPMMKLDLSGLWQVYLDEEKQQLLPEIHLFDVKFIK